MPDPTTTATGAPATVIAHGTSIKGEIVADAPARILGNFEGRIVSQGRVEIGPEAATIATIEAHSIVIEGRHKGDLLAKDRIQLNQTASVAGDLIASTLVVAEGASFMGHCRVGTEAVAEARQAERRPASPAARPAPTIEAKTGPLGSAIAELGATLAGLSRVDRTPSNTGA